jgi:Protein of unknown function (DUF4231)
MDTPTTDDAPKPAKPAPWTDRPPRAYGALTAAEYITERLNPIRAWYDKEASKAKSKYLWMRTVTVVGGAVVPVLINLDWPYMKVLTTGISLLVVILLSLESVLHFREQWKSYRSTEQTLEQEYYNFAAAEGAYRGMDAAKAFLEFVDRVESAIAAENASTLNVMTTASDQARPAKIDALAPPAAPAPKP